MKTLRALLVTYSFPPCGGTGVMRVSSLARYFPGEGIQVDVLTARNAATVGADNNLLKSIPDEVAIHRTLTLDLPFGIKKYIKRIVSGRAKHSIRSPSASVKGTPNALGKVLAGVLSPDPQVTWVPVLKRIAAKIIKKKHIDVVLITVPPFSSLLLAEHLRKQFPDLIIVLDFRDEWLRTTFSLVSFLFNTTEKAHALAQKIERRAISAASLVVTVTEAARKEIQSRYPGEPDSKFKLVPNGYDADGIVRNSQRPSGRGRSTIIVTFVGTVYTSTDPSSLVEALETLPMEIRQRFKLRFIGHIEGEQYKQMLLRLGETVELTGFLPQQKALAFMGETDYVLLINHDPLNIGGKFYDYVGAGKPILGLVHPQGETRRLMDELRAGWWASIHDVSGIRELFADAAARLGSLEREFRPDIEKIAQYERQPLAHRYAGFLKAMFGRNTTVERAGAEAAIVREA